MEAKRFRHSFATLKQKLKIKMGEAREQGYLLTSFPVRFQVKIVLENGHILTGEQRAPSENYGGVSDSCSLVNVWRAHLLLLNTLISCMQILYIVMTTPGVRLQYFCSKCVCVCVCV